MSCDATTAKPPGVWVVEFYQGASFNPTLRVVADGDPVDLTFYTAIFTVKNDSGDVILKLTSDDGLTLNADGTCVFSVDPETTSALPIGSYSYDLLLTYISSGLVIPLVAGPAVVLYSPTGGA